MTDEPINLVVNSQTEGGMTLDLFTKSGQLVQQKQVDLLAGNNSIHWEFQSLPAATYTLRLSTDKSTKSYQIVKI